MRATLFFLIALTVAGCGSTNPAPALTDAVQRSNFASPNLAATPTSIGSPTAVPSLPPDAAEVSGHVIDAASRAPVVGATVRLVPFNVVVTSATDGAFGTHRLAVTGRCRWLTIEVDAPGHGKLVIIDSPVYPGHRGYFDLQVRAEEQRVYLGPPRAEAHLGDAFCSR